MASHPPPRRGALGTYTRGYLPHYDHVGLLHAVTFRLGDALPRSAFACLGEGALDAELDRGHGSCLLQHEEAATLVVGALHHFRAARYELGLWVVMPNHVHVVLRPFEGHGLGAIVHSWKSYTAKQINLLTGQTGALWQREYFDTVIHNRRHLVAVTRYVHDHPVAARLVARAEDWRWSSARNPAYMALLGDGT
jgi:REP element-mobilizing transposase RayT